MVSPPRVRGLSPAWRSALAGALASLPATAVLNWLPNSEATVGGGIMIVGGLVAGGVAAVRSTDPGAAGLRAGLLGGVVAALAFVVTLDPTSAWPPSRVVFWTVSGGVVLCLASVFGLGCGRVGGWVASAVAPDPKAGANAS